MYFDTRHGKLMAEEMKTSYLLVKVKRFSLKIRNKTKGHLFYLLLFYVVLGILARQNRQNKAIEIIQIVNKVISVLEDMFLYSEYPQY